MSFNKSIKSDALLALKNNWLKAIVITCIGLLIFFMSTMVETFIFTLTNIDHFEIIDILNNLIFCTNSNISMSNSILTFIIISTVVSIIYCCIFSILKMGNIFWNYTTIYNKDNNFFNLFYYFSSVKNILISWNISIQIFIREVIWSIIIFLPSFIIGSWTIIATISSNYTYKQIIIPAGYILLFCLIIASFIICMIFFQRYFLVRYLIISGECKQVKKAIKLSTKIMKGKKINSLTLILSFLGWIISFIFIFPIFFASPYIKISLTLYSRYLIEEYNNNINLENHSAEN